MKKLGFDLRALQDGFKAHKARGIGVYSRNLIQRKNLAPADLDITSFYDPGYESSEAGKFGATPYKIGKLAGFIRPRMKEYAFQTTVFRRAVERTLRASGAGLLFFPSHLDVPAGLRVRYAVTAHDMIQAALQGKFYNSFKHKVDIARQVQTLRGAAHIIAVSRHTKDDVVKHAGVPEGKVTVVYNGVDPGFRPGVGAALERFDLPEKFVINVGGIDWRKNVGLLLDSFAALVREKPDWRLVMTGAIEDDPLYPGFLAALKERGLERSVMLLGYVSREELIALYNRAAFLIYPSLYEGFGLPVLEAMACGAPVITTNRTSIPEVAGGAALALDPDEPDSFREAVIKLANSEGERKKLSEAGIKRAAMFTWDKCAKETYQTLSAIF